MALSVCVCGWYLDKYDPLYRTLWKLHHRVGVPVCVVSNRPDTFLEVMDLPHVVRENSGLEFGAYEHFLKNAWDGTSGVVFMHDDIEIGPFVRGYDLMPPERAWDGFNTAAYDHAYVFKDRADEVENEGKHGRMVYLSAQALRLFRDLGGIPYDGENRGNTITGHVNKGIELFDGMLDILTAKGMRVRERVYMPWFKSSRRGRGEAWDSTNQLHALNIRAV